MSKESLADSGTVEPQYELLFRIRDRHGVSRFGLMANESWNQDPKRTLFTLARYKFVAKMLAGRGRVLEVGCADAFGTRIVQQHVGGVTAVDFDPIFISDIAERSDPAWPLTSFVHDILAGPVPDTFDAAFALDVLEHIPSEGEELFVRNIAASLAEGGVLILGMPSLESQVYASPQSRAGHVNCKTESDFKSLMEKHFRAVFSFSMNDEVVHTGFSRMAHYLLMVCADYIDDSSAR